MHSGMTFRRLDFRRSLDARSRWPSRTTVFAFAGSSSCCLDAERAFTWYVVVIANVNDVDVAADQGGHVEIHHGHLTVSRTYLLASNLLSFTSPYTSHRVFFRESQLTLFDVSDQSFKPADGYSHPTAWHEAQGRRLKRHGEAENQVRELWSIHLPCY